ncbi:MAG: hypothetical protein U0872_13850 [Planctomycetaceae bacterium]
MKVQQFLEHHGLSQNPFSQEDAQTDPLFKQHCAKGTYHPAWDKIFGSAEEPSTSVVFGEKGSGKTALRLQIVEQLAEHGRKNSDRRVFVVEYDNFNPFLDSFHERMASFSRSPERTLAHWKLWDHMDAILSLAVTKLIDDILTERTQGPPGPFEVHADRLAQLSHSQRRDLLLLTAYYDHSTHAPPVQRWNQLRRRLKFANWLSWRDFGIGLVITLVVFGFLAEMGWWSTLKTPWPWLILLAGWVPWLWKQSCWAWQAWQVSRQVKVFDHPVSPLRSILASFDGKDLINQPAPTRERSDDRYELLGKLQSILRTLGFSSMMILVDRLDEPHLINGSPERMKALLWPMLDNKFLQHAGLGFKLLLPIEVSFFLSREDKSFYERSRLDKQNMIRSLEWTGESLYDLANERIKAGYTGAGTAPKLKNWFDESITEPELVGTLGRLRVPRHLFKFLYRLLVEHCHRYTDDNPRWTIGREELQSTLAVYLRDLEAFDRGLGTG